MIEKLIDNVDKNRIYKIITDLEGPKHPIDNMDELNEAGDYIINYLTELGIDIKVHSFKVKGFEEEFRNIIGVIGDPSKPAILIGSHYDTVRFCPGANDNLSAVAVSLEVARQLSVLKNPPTVMIAAFTLEEGHPGAIKYRDELLFKEGLTDIKGRYTSPNLIVENRKLFKKAKQLRINGQKITERYKTIIADETSSEDEIRLATVLDKVYEVYNPDHLEEDLALVGSRAYVKKVIKEKIDIKSMLVYDCLGWIKHDQGTQKKLPLTPEMAPFLNAYKVDMDNLVGNFIGIAGDKYSIDAVKHFAHYCGESELDMPHLEMNLPLDYAQLKKMLPDVLRSDHSPFWEAGIPGIFISDFANFRSELYHTPGDQSNLLDYDMLKKITQATIKYIVNM